MTCDNCGGEPAQGDGQQPQAVAPDPRLDTNQPMRAVWYVVVVNDTVGKFTGYTEMFDDMGKAIAAGNRMVDQWSTAEEGLVVLIRPGMAGGG